MKKIILLLNLALLASAGYAQSRLFLSLSEAEKILGTTAYLVTNSSETTNRIIKNRYTYTAKKNSGEGESSLYFFLEEYPDASAAEKSFDYILSQNEGIPGLYRLPGYGDEAIMQTDSINFQLIMVRKSNKIIRMKVNKLTSTTSSQELKSITKKITDQL